MHINVQDLKHGEVLGDVSKEWFTSRTAIEL